MTGAHRRIIVRCCGLSVGSIACTADRISASSETNQTAFGHFYPPLQQPNPTAIRSLFAHKPATVFFSTNPSQPPSWIESPRLINCDTPAYTVRAANHCNTIEALMYLAGLRQVEKTRDWQLGLGVWPCPLWLKPGQRVNRIHGTGELGNKDRLAINLAASLSAARRDSGAAAAAAEQWFPDTYVLPEEVTRLKEIIQDSGAAWFIKPALGSEGRGHTIVETASELEQALKNNPELRRVAQRYIDKPLLVHGRKFDLRIYICITSFDPLVLYISDLGFVKLATGHWQKGDYSNRSIHWGNMAINKNNENFEISTGTGTIAERPKSSRFTLQQFKEHLQTKLHVDPSVVWSKIDDLCINAVLAVKPQIRAALAKRGGTRMGYFEMFGVDLALDEEFKPWLLEVNCGPSLSSPSQLDWEIKGGVLADVLNLVGLPACPPTEGATRLDPCVYEMSTQLSSNQLKILQSFEDEQSRKAPHLRRLYPPASIGIGSDQGAQEHQQQLNGMSELDKVLWAWLYSVERRGLGAAALGP